MRRLRRGKRPKDGDCLRPTAEFPPGRTLPEGVTAEMLESFYPCTPCGVRHGEGPVERTALRIPAYAPLRGCDTAA